MADLTTSSCSRILAPFRPFDVHRAAAESACGAEAGRPGGGAGIRAERRPRVAAHGRGLQPDHVGEHRGGRCVHLPRTGEHVPGGGLRQYHRARHSEESTYTGDGPRIRWHRQAEACPTYRTTKLALVV